MNQRARIQSELRGTPFESGRVVQEDTHTCKQVFIFVCFFTASAASVASIDGVLRGMI
jgi:hypothetical protein